MIFSAAEESPAPLSVTTVRSRTALSALESRWNSLVGATPAPNPFLTWEWITTWYDHLAPDSELRVLVARGPDDGELVGIAPFVIQRPDHVGPELWSELVFMGCTTTAPDHLDCIVRRGWERPVSRAFADRLLSKGGGGAWDVIRLDGMSPGSLLTSALLARIPSSEVAAWSIPCPYVSLPDDFADFESDLDGKFRRNLHRRLRKLKRETEAPISLVTVTGGEDVADALSVLFRLHQAIRRSNGSDGGAFDTPAKRRFYEELAPRFADRGWLRLHLLKVGERPIGAALCFHFGEKLWFYQTGYDPSWSRYSPGSQVIRHAIRCAIEEGASEFDLLRGDHAYKYDWNAESRDILKTRIASTLPGRAVVPVTGILREGRKKWKDWQRAH